MIYTPYIYCNWPINLIRVQGTRCLALLIMDTTFCAHYIFFEDTSSISASPFIFSSIDWQTCVCILMHMQN